MPKAKRHPARSRSEPVAHGHAREWLVVGLAAAGVLIALYLTYTKLARGTALFCAAGGGCDVVQASRYATFLGLPTALWGAGLFAAIGAVALAGLAPRRWLWAFLLAVAAVSFSAYLAWLSMTEIRALCGWCLASGLVAVALLGALLFRRPPASGHAPRLRAPRLAAYAAVVAVATVVSGAGVYAGSPSSAEASYRDALARHLTESGAVMYGAFW